MVTTIEDSSLLEAVVDNNVPTSERRSLQRSDWLRQALTVFVISGIDAIRITRLAADLDVSRGSFYWHFENREELIDAVVEFWKRKNTEAIRLAVRDASSLEKGIFYYFEIIVNENMFDPRLDLAVREWARRSPKIRALVDSEDNQRIEALRLFYLRFDYAMPEALIRARVLYFSQIGFYALSVQESLSTRLTYTEAYFECFTGRTLDARERVKFVDDILSTYGDAVP